MNKKAEDEITAHRTMFTPKEHPGYYAMSNKAKDFVVRWVDQGWYDGSEEVPTEDADGGAEVEPSNEDEQRV